MSKGVNTIKLTDRIFSNLEFDLRTLLNGFVGPIQLLKYKLDDPDLVEIFRLLDSSLYRLERLGNRSRIVSLLEGDDNIPFSKSPLNIVDVIRYSIIDLHSISDLENVKIIVDHNEDPLTVLGDYEMLLQAFEIIFEYVISLSSENSRIEVFFTNSENEVICTLNSPSVTFSSEFIALNKEAASFQELPWEIILAFTILKKHNASFTFHSNRDNLNALNIVFKS